jgi:hypothetical protein
MLQRPTTARCLSAMMKLHAERGFDDPATVSSARTRQSVSRRSAATWRTCAERVCYPPSPAGPVLAESY